MRKNWILASHVLGVLNIQADVESRYLVEDTQWMINTKIFLSLVERWGSPTIDLFSSRVTNQILTYASWIPDPGAAFVDAFSIKWNQF